jgi:hypothetical protein
MWLRAPDELTARPFWLISLASLAMASALRGNPVGAVAWSCALVLSGGAFVPFVCAQHLVKPRSLDRDVGHHCPAILSLGHRLG